MKVIVIVSVVVAVNVDVDTTVGVCVGFSVLVGRRILAGSEVYSGDSVMALSETSAGDVLKIDLVTIRKNATPTSIGSILMPPIKF